MRVLWSMGSHAAETLPREGHTAAVRRWTANASVATLVAGLITFAQWLAIDRPQQDKLTSQGSAALLQADATSLYDKVSTELTALISVVDKQVPGDPTLPETAKALAEARSLDARAFDLLYRQHDYAKASRTLIVLHDTVLSAVCLVQHFTQACKAVDARLEAPSSA
jgi:hypothetical protein